METEVEVGQDELRDPSPDIDDLFAYYNSLYFRGCLRSCIVKWSSFRMNRCTGACKYLPGSVCEIRLSEPLLKYCPTADLKNTLLHEMIHAFLWIHDKNKNHSEHGPSFEAIMRSINSSNVMDHQRPSDGYNISIYHDFHEEVDRCKVHAWLCESCGDFIKRDVNRKPSASDCSKKLGCAKSCGDSSCHWHEHKMSCSGSYMKIAEPPGYKGNQKAGILIQENQVKESCSSRRKSKRLHELDEMKNSSNKQKDDANRSGNIAFSRNDLERKAQSKELMAIKSETANDYPLHTVVLKRPRTSVCRKQSSCNHTKRKKSRKYKDLCPVMSAWLDYYAVEESDEDIDPLINKRTERRKKLKLLQTVPKVAEIHEFSAHGGNGNGDGRFNYPLSYDRNIATWSNNKLLGDGCTSSVNSPTRNDAIDISDG